MRTPAPSSGNPVGNFIPSLIIPQPGPAKGINSVASVGTGTGTGTGTKNIRRRFPPV